MNINYISSIYQAKNYFNHSKRILFKGNLPCDTFESNITKPDKIDNKAIKWMEENDFVRKHLIDTISNEDNIIGYGFSHVAFKIPGNDDYVLRMEKFTMPQQDVHGYEIKDIEDKNLKINIGQPVAEIVLDPEEFPEWAKVEVLRRQNGEPVGVKPHQAVFDEVTGELKEGELPYGDIERKQTYEKTIHKIAQLPLQAYEKLISDLRTAYNCGYSFDYYNSNNILVDEEGQALNLIDMDAKASDVDFGSVLYALTNIYYFPTYSSKLDGPVMSDEKINQTIQDTITIIDKYTQAMKNQGEKFSKTNSSMYFYELLNSIACRVFLRAFDTQGQWLKLEEMGIA